MREKILTDHKGSDVGYVVEVLTGYGRLNCRYMNGSSNRSRKIICLAMVKFPRSKLIECQKMNEVLETRSF